MASQKDIKKASFVDGVVAGVLGVMVIGLALSLAISGLSFAYRTLKEDIAAEIGTRLTCDVTFQGSGYTRQGDAVTVYRDGIGYMTCKGGKK